MFESFFFLLLGGMILARAIATDRVFLRIQRIGIFLAALYIGQHALGSNPQIPLPAAILGCVGVSILSGLSVGEIIFGHMPAAASVKIMTLSRMNRILIAAVALRMFFGVCAPLMEVRWPTGNFWQEHSVAMAIRWAIGLMVPMILLCLAQQRIRQEMVRQSMKLLLPATLMILIGEAIALHLTQLTGLPF